jgi:hypothetical protein
MSAPVTTVCLDDGQVTLTGNPSGGIYSGSGVIGSGFIPAAGAGTHTLEYYYTDPNGCTGMASMVMEVNECTGLNRLSEGNQTIMIYPNPATNLLTIKNELQGRNTAVITDAAGRLVIEQTISSTEEAINIQTLSNGLYILSLRNSSGATLQNLKFVKE